MDTTERNRIAWAAVERMMNIARGMGYHSQINSGQQHYAAKCIMEELESVEKD